MEKLGTARLNRLSDFSSNASLFSSTRAHFETSGISAFGS